MKEIKNYYDPDGNRHDSLPGTWNNISPFTERVAIAHGWSVETYQFDDDEPVEKDDTDFRSACAAFRAVCAEIGEFIGVEDFKGGFDDYPTFINSVAAERSKATASLLAAKWNGLNELCRYEAGKLGLGTPEWWYKCWQMVEEV
jgi:hypothetical protein